MQAHQSVALQRRLWIALHWRLVPLIGAAGHATALTALPRLRSVAAAARRARAAAAEAGVDGGGLAGGGRAVPVCVGRANRCRHSAALPARQMRMRTVFLCAGCKANQISRRARRGVRASA